jgi:two-component system sensor histidine kinase RpfC
MLSANVTTEVVAECQRAGCAEFLPKPIRPTTLLDAIEFHMANLTGDPANNAVPPPVRTDERPALTVVDSPAVDQSVLADLGRLSPDPTFVERLLTGFRSDTERLVKAIADALATRNYEAVKDAAHALKGGGGSVGAVRHDTLRMRAAAWMEELTRAEATAIAALERHLEERRHNSSKH